MEKLFKIFGIVVDPISKMPILILESEDGKNMPIWIGVFEANAIALELEGVKTPRPMTHDLMKNFLEKVELKVEKIVVNDIKDNTFYALIHCVHQGSKKMLFDSRPSDAIALALRVNAPIYVEDEVLGKSHSMVIKILENPDALKKWLESLKLEDFGKYKM